MKQKQLFIKAACLILLLATGAARAQNVGIGTNAPQSQLQVVGKTTTDSLRITGGAAAGKLLTSNGNGDAVWTNPAFITTGRNGLEQTADTLQLGGNLLRNTTINTAGHSLGLAKTGAATQGTVANNTAVPNYFVPAGSHLQQSFEVTEACQLDSIRVYLVNIGSSSCVAELYEGEGISTVFLTSTPPFSYPAYSVPTPYTLLFPPLSMQVNKRYTIRLLNGTGWLGNTGDPYKQGMSNILPNIDLLFTVYGSYTPVTGLVVQQSGDINISGQLRLTKQTALELGARENKEPNAGKIGYQLFTPDALDIVGAGTENNNRKIKFWAEGGVTFNGPLIATLQQEAVQTPVLLNGWLNHGGGFTNAGYWKDKEGLVHICGLIKNGNIATSTVLFVLPADYRPATRHIFNVNANNTFGRVDVLPSGEVMIAVVSSNAFLNLNGISFRTN